MPVSTVRAVKRFIQYDNNKSTLNVRRIALCVCMVLSALLFQSCGVEEIKPVEANLPKFVAQAVSPEGRTKIIIGSANTAQAPISFKDGLGLAKDIVAAINQSQKEYYLEHTFLPAEKLQNEVKNKGVHVAAFHNLKWGWEGQRLQRSLVMLQGSDVFVTLKAYKNSSDLFRLGKDVSKLGVKGYHYRFNYGVKEEAKLKKEFNMGLLEKERSVLDAVLSKEAQVGVVSTMLLHYFELKNPNEYKKLLVSKKYDSIYDMYYVFPKDAPISETAFNDLLKLIAKNGTMEIIYQQYGLPLPVWAISNKTE